MTNTRKKRLCVIINPVSGTRRDDEEQIRAILDSREDVKYKILLTEKAGDAKRFAEEAARDGVDFVVACGGDGTMVEAASGLLNVETPLVLLPSGTANVLGEEMSIPAGHANALKLALDDDHVVRDVDIGCIDDRFFMLAAAIGYGAAISGGAKREEKSRFGKFAYVITAWRTLRGLRSVKYRLTLDGEKVETRGITCLVINSSKLGLGNIKLAEGVDSSDGLLNVVVVRSLRPNYVLRVAFWNVYSRLTGRPHTVPPLIRSWTAREIDIAMSGRQRVAYDGEMLRKTKSISIRVLPQAVKVIVPR